YSFAWARWYSATALVGLGLFDQAEEECSRILAEVPAGGLAILAKIGQASIRLHQRRLDEASTLATCVVRVAVMQRHPNFCLIGRMVLLEAELLKGALDAAEAEATALGALVAAPVHGMWYWAMLARVRLAEGRAGEAVALAERAYARSRALGIGLAD